MRWGSFVYVSKQRLIFLYKSPLKDVSVRCYPRQDMMKEEKNNKWKQALYSQTSISTQQGNDNGRQRALSGQKRHDLFQRQ